MYGIKNEIDNLVIGEGEGAIERRQKKLMRIKKEVILLRVLREKLKKFGIPKNRRKTKITRQVLGLQPQVMATCGFQ